MGPSFWFGAKRDGCQLWFRLDYRKTIPGMLLVFCIIGLPRDWKSPSGPVIIIRLKSRKLRNDEKFTSANHEAREHASSKQPWNSRIPPLKNWKIWLTWNSNETRRKGGTKSDRSQNYDLSSCLGFTKNIAWVHWGPKGVRIQHNIKSRVASSANLESIRFMPMSKAV